MKSFEIKNQAIRFLLGECDHPETGEGFSLANEKALSNRIARRYWWRSYLRNESLNYEKEITRLTKRVEELEEGLRKIEKIKWGNDGDCGALNIINELIDD